MIMSKVFKRFYGCEYKNLASMIFGYLLLFICFPFYLPYYYADKISAKINMSHGFSESDSKLYSNYYRNDSLLITNFVINIISGVVFVITLPIYLFDKSAGMSVIVPLIPFLITTVIMPIVMFLGNVRTDYVKPVKPTKSKREEISNNFYESMEKKKQPCFHENLKEFKNNL
jgi:hypothetical protein